MLASKDFRAQLGGPVAA